jgi:hypothetical protein
MKGWAIRSVVVWTLGLAALIWWGGYGAEPEARTLPPARGSDLRAACSGMVDVIMVSVAAPAPAPAVAGTAWLPDIGRSAFGAGAGDGGEAALMDALQRAPVYIEDRADERVGEARKDDALSVAGGDWGWLNNAIRENTRIQDERRQAFDDDAFGWDMLNPVPGRDELPMDRLFQSKGLADHAYGQEGGNDGLFGE